MANEESPLQGLVVVEVKLEVVVEIEEEMGAVVKVEVAKTCRRGYSNIGS